MRALPVDFRNCREDACAEGRDGIRVARSITGEPAAVFTHVVDCRPGSETPGADCSGAAAGNRYIQYWLYYPGSATGEGSTFLRGVIREVSERGRHPTYHPDDWESVQLRIHPDGSVRGPRQLPPWLRLGLAARRRAPPTRSSGGSHAGTVEPAEFDRHHHPAPARPDPAGADRRRSAGTEFAVTPPWQKRVWLEPEYEGTD